MDYIKTYKSFINSHYLTEGIRMTVGILIPAFLMSFFDMLSFGLVLSLGALFVSITDSPGPIHHRRNGMLTCIASLIIVVVLTNLCSSSPVLLGVFLVVACFFFSMINVYGTRAASIGIVSMIVLTINVGHGLTMNINVWEQAALVGLGGLWYMSFSLLLYNFRPYRLAQQALGECLQEIAEYLRIRADFFNKNVDYESTYGRLLHQQAIVQQKQDMLGELIFKTRSIVKETTHVGRILVMIYLDAADIFERIMMSHQKYSLLHEYFDETDILTDFHNIALELANDLDEVGIALKSGSSSIINPNLTNHINKLKEKREQLRLTYLKPDNIEGFISLRLILENIQDLAERLQTLHLYTTYDRSIKKKRLKEADYESFISSQQITPNIFLDNLSLKSDIFRHSIRLSAAILTGYLVSFFFTIGHSYWILLTIVVIVKPAYSLSKQRNADRLTGTIAGVFIGLGIVYVVHNHTAILCLMILFMAGAYSFLRKNYLISVLLMTPYLVLFYHLLNPNEFNALLKDRIVDTIIGSAIGFTSSLFLLPSWERERINELMIDMITGAKNYFVVIAGAFSGEPIINNKQQVARKNALVALANLSDAFNRMLSEPKSRQKEIQTLHRFVVLHHMLTSYIATLAYYIRMQTNVEKFEEFVKVTNNILQYFTNAAVYLNKQNVVQDPPTYKETLRLLNDKVNILLQKRREEIEAGEYETSTKKILFDLKSIVDQFNLIYNVALEINKLSQAYQAV